MLSPFIHKFQSLNHNFYIYDVNTNKIIRVNKLVYDIIDDLQSLSKQEIILKWQGNYRTQDIENALQNIDTQHKKGYLSAHRLKKMEIPYSNTSLEKKLRSKLGDLVLNISEQCNLRCRYCCYGNTYKYERNHTNRIMQKDIIEKALLFYHQHSFEASEPGVSFYGGEALTAFTKIVHAVNFLKNLNGKRKYDIKIDTNGVLLNEHIIDYIIKNNIGLQVSIDGPEHIHNKYRVTKNGKPTFAKIIGNLDMLRCKNKKLYNEVSFACTLCPSYDLFEINDFFENNELVKNHSLSISFLEAFDTTFFEEYDEEENYVTQRKQEEELKKNYIAARINNQKPTNVEKSLFDRSLVRIHLRSNKRLGDTIGPNGCCIPGARKLYIDTNGRFQPCERVGQGFYIGDVHSGFNTEHIINFINKYIEASGDKCLSCWAVRLCPLCFGYALKGDRINAERKKENCIRRLHGLHNDFVTYATIMEANPNAFDFAKRIIISA